jgi:alkanesulfonate monooxygenase SsuD/methylene tetrahydromethanopterin reductase-like flavin-dependent oxidoreductase (luciferase family)
MYVTDSAADADRILADVLAPTVQRPVEELRELSLPIGSAEVCAERLAAFAQAGAERIFVWPLADPVHQLELFRERVVPLV